MEENDRMNRDMTVISGNNMAFLMGEEKTPRQMVEFLKEGAMFRGFNDVLKRVYPGEDLASRLAQGLSEMTGEEYGSISRKVRNWLKGQNMPKNRETLFQICFVLGLGEAEAGLVLGAASETGIHYRNPDELVYAYALRTRKSYEEAVELRTKVRQSQVIGRKDNEKEKAESPVYTKQVRDAFSQVSCDEELFAFFREHGRELGTLHETAYAKFAELLDYLQNPKGESGEMERKFTMEEVVRDYIRMNVPQTKKVSDYILLQRLVKKYWPNESNLLNMRNRKEDVSRKVLILLYLITEAFDEMEEEAGEEDYYLDDFEEDEDSDTRLEIRFEKMNLFLDSYGMNLLDPGNPFDFLVLYAMKTQEGDFVSDRMEAVLSVLFEEE